MEKYKKESESLIRSLVLRWAIRLYKETGGKTNRKGKITKTFKKWLSDNDYKNLVIWINKKEKEWEEGKN